jgi:murein DD-endopeptidase MepM/ murein hydrolase activator NlpD
MSGRGSGALCAGLLIIAALICGRPALSDDKWTMPVNPACISSPFGWRHAVGPMAPAGLHNGIDMPAPAGGHVHAVAAGRIRLVKKMGLGGLQVDVQHPDGLVTIYSHLGSVAPAIATGQRQVAAGTWLGRIGRTGVTYGTHLFFMVMRNGQAVDPAPYLGISPCK